jgi:N-acetylmuramoyl-L-alanine amidase
MIRRPAIMTPGKLTAFVAAVLFVFIMISSFFAVSADAATTLQQYEKIKKDYQKFLKDEGKKTYRHFWLRHIDRFLALQKRHPKSTRADDSLYMAAGAYVKLHEYSYLKDDLKKAVKYNDSLAAKYPKSNLADDGLVRAGQVLEKLGDKKGAYKRYAMCVLKFPKGDLTSKARAALKRLLKYAPKPTPKPKPAATPKPTPAPTPVAEKTPVSPPALSAITQALSEAGLKETEKPVDDDTAGDKEGLALEPIPLEVFGVPIIRKISHWSNPDYTRIVIELSEKVNFQQHLLEKVPGSQLPRRLYLDFENCHLPDRMDKDYPIGDGLLKQVRAGQNTEDVVRVVLDIETIGEFQVFPLLDPFRVVIDVSGEKRTVVAAKPPAPTAKRRIWKVVIDAGHGGTDPGAMSRGGDRETDLALSIAKLVEKEFKKDKNIKVLLTRRSDRFITLPQRPAIANSYGADLFVSIHINAARNRKASGIEVYNFAPKAGADIADLVAAENATDVAGVMSMNTLLDGLTLLYKRAESNNLAAKVQSSMLVQARKQYRDVKSRRIRGAPFYVLLGAKMPAILVECGFITNSTELRRLKNKRYQKALALGIAQGVRQYFSEFD